MKQLRLLGLSYTKNKCMSELILELKNKSDVLFLKEPKPTEVVRVAYDAHNNTIETEDRHAGFYDTYATFYYRGFIFYIQASDYYPFTDDNFPAPVCFIAYKRVGTTKKLQLTYFTAYDGIKSLDDWIENQTKPISGTVVQAIDPWISSDTFTKVDHIIGSIGGYRENGIWEEYPFLLVSETWNNDHKVVRVVSSVLHDDDDGMRRFCEVDLVSNTICG